MKTDFIHLGQLPDPAVLEATAEFICGDDTSKFPIYRSSSYLTMFFQNIGINVEHDGSTRKWWVLATLNSLSPSDLEKVILRLVNPKEYKGDREMLKMAYKAMSDILSMESLKIVYNGAEPYLTRIKTLDIDIATLENAHDSAESEFLQKEFSDDIDIDLLNLDTAVTKVLKSRIEEIKQIINKKASLSVVFLLGSTLEGILLGTGITYPQIFMSCKSAPKEKSGKVKKIHDWKLAELIDVAYETGFIKLDVKKFSHVLRDFRNYIHPYEQVAQGFSPDKHTIDICWQVFKGAYSQVVERNNVENNHE